MIAFKIAFLAAAGGTLGFFVIRGSWQVLGLLALKLVRHRTASSDLAAADKIIDGWRKMPHRDSRGRFSPTK